jgi:hypothetical protein
MRHSTSLLYHVCAVASHNIRFASCGTSGKLTLRTCLLLRVYMYTLYIVNPYRSHYLVGYKIYYKFMYYLLLSLFWAVQIDPLKQHSVLCLSVRHFSIKEIDASVRNNEGLFQHALWTLIYVLCSLKCKITWFLFPYGLKRLMPLTATDLHKDFLCVAELHRSWHVMDPAGFLRQKFHAFLFVICCLFFS